MTGGGIVVGGAVVGGAVVGGNVGGGAVVGGNVGGGAVVGGTVGGVVLGGALVVGGVVLGGALAGGALVGGAVVVEGFVVLGGDAIDGDVPSAKNPSAEGPADSSSEKTDFVPLLRRALVAVGFGSPDESFGPSLDVAVAVEPAALAAVSPASVDAPRVRTWAPEWPPRVSTILDLSIGWIANAMTITPTAMNAQIAVVMICRSVIGPLPADGSPRPGVGVAVGAEEHVGASPTSWPGRNPEIHSSGCRCPVLLAMWSMIGQRALTRHRTAGAAQSHQLDRG